MTELWNWYLNLYQSDDKVRVATWAATIGTITFLITFFFKPVKQYVTSLSSKVKVTAEMRHTLYLGSFGRKKGPVLIKCTIVNKSSNPIYIKQPGIKLSRKIDRKNRFSLVLLNEQHKFPMKLEHGQQQEFEYDTVDLVEQVICRIKERDKVCFTIESTIGKQYSSNNLTKKKIVAHIEA
ncbi:MAG: hypothetical protein Q7T20_08990 [Saprospiraceae bacterium]|nr:hypothetical protein [Saprospiraceae bacterium]